MESVITRLELRLVAGLVTVRQVSTAALMVFNSVGLARVAARRLAATSWIRRNSNSMKMWSRFVGMKAAPKPVAPSTPRHPPLQAAAFVGADPAVAERILTASRTTVRLTPR
jgi:hypothetical protein